MRARQMYSRVGIEADLPAIEDARLATKAVLQTLRDRLTPEEARQAMAQLPGELKELWAAGELEERRPLKLHRREFCELVKERAELPTIKTAELATRAVFAALK